MNLTIDAADAIAAVLNGAGLTEGITFSRTLFPEFNPENLEEPSGQCFPASIEESRADRSTDQVDHVVEVGIGRKLDDEEADSETHLETIEEIRDKLKELAREITTPTEGETLLWVGMETTLFVPELLRKRVALSVIRLSYRNWE